jgi:SOS response regulatory protein OraA/RecX
MPDAPDRRLQEPEFRDALSVALKLLKSKDRFAQEVEQALRDQGHGEPIIAAVLQFLVERRVLDDQKTTQRTAERYSGKRAAGREKIATELRERGAPEEALESVLTSLSDDEELERMTTLLEAKMKRSDPRAKGGRLLLSRGFEPDLVERALDLFFGPEELPF